MRANKMAGKPGYATHALIRWTPLFIIVVFLWAGNTDAASQWQQHRGRHFIIYYKNAPVDFVKSVDEAAEDYYQEITQDLGFTRYKGWMWDDRAKIYIYDDQEDYINSARAYRWSHGSAYAKQKVIMTFPSAHGFFDSTLPHEMGHIIFREFVGDNPFVPLWLEEGVAMYQEKAKRWGANQKVKQALENGNFIPLDELSKIRLSGNTSQAIVDLFYTQSASIVYFMISELGEFKFVNLCRKLKKGDSFKKALRGAYIRFRDLDDLNRAWLAYLEKQ